MPTIIINEFYRGGTLTTTDEFIELLVLEDLTATQLDSFFVGDSTGTKASKFSAHDFTNTGTIASVFRAGTIVTIGGLTAITQDTSYNPAGSDWNIALNAGSSFLPNANSGNNGDIAGDDVVWVDTANTGATISADGFAVDIGTATGAFTAAATVNFGASTNNTGYTLNTDLSGAGNTANWTTGIAFAATTAGQPNGGANTTYINSLRGSAPAALTIAASPSTFSEAVGATAAVGTVTRSGDLTNPLTVTLNSNDTSEATVPTTVTILANQATATFNIAAVDDAIVDGSQSVRLTATATGFASASTSVTVTDDEVAPLVRIHDIQGAAHISPLLTSATVAAAVQNVAGIVTAIASNGFYIQDPTPDNNIATSEAIFVFTGATSPIRTARSVGEAVLVSGTVSEFRPGGSADNLTVTQISNNTSVQALSVAAWTTAPTTTIIPTVLGIGGRAIPTAVIENDATNVESSGTFDPAEDGIDFYESLEGMLVQVNNPVTTSPTATFGTSQEIWVLADNGANATSRTVRGGSLVNASDFNPERLQIDDLDNALVLPDVNVGAQLSTIVGVVNYDFGNYEVLVPTAPTVVQASPLQKEVTNLTSTTNQLTVATFNVENLDPGDGAAKFNALASAIVTNLRSPDIISLEEIQDNNGPTNDSVVDASVTLQTLINAITAAGGPTYEFRQINPVDDTNGGEPGGNIRVGFLFNPGRVSFVDRPGGTSTSSTTVTDTGNDRIPDLSASPGLIDPTNPAFNSSRKPLVGEFVFNGQTVYVIGNHFNSKGGDQPLFGVNQPPALSSETQRNQQATIVRNFVQSILAIDPNANVVVAGDLNDFEFSNPLNILKSGGLTALIETLPANERYTYNFEGNAQTLDHILTSQNLVNNLDGFDVVHINSEFADQVSDHDPSVARFTLLRPNAIPVANRDAATTNEDTAVTFNVLTNDTDANNDALTVASFTNPTNGVLTNNGAGSFTYTPGLNFNGSDGFTYTISDGKGGTASAPVSITINSVNDAPVNTVPGSQTAVQDSFLVFSAANGNAIAISDVDANGGLEQVNLSVSNGFLNLSSSNGLTIVNGSNNSAAITVRGTLSDLNSALNGLRFTPTAPSVIAGAATLTILTDDLGNTGAGGAKTDTDTVAIAINPANLVRGNGGNNILFGSLRSDTIYGGSGNDTLSGLGGNDILLGEEGNDNLFGGFGNDYLDGGNGNDRLTDLGGSNTIFGRAGNDTIVVGFGTNLIDGGSGNDTIYLSFGQDTIALARGSGTDTVYNYEAGSTRFSLGAGLTFNDLTIAQDGSSTLIRAGSERLASLAGVRANSVTASSFITA